MYIENIETLPVPELMDLLVRNTVELLDMMNQRGADGFLILQKKKDVQVIQSAIARKKSETGPSSFQPSSVFN